MSQHYTSSTVEASAWCKKCRRETLHQVHSKILGACLVCLKKLEESKTAPAQAPKPEQGNLFGR